MKGRRSRNGLREEGRWLLVALFFSVVSAYDKRRLKLLR